MTASIIEPDGFRMLPTPDELNRAFWTGGANGQLLIQRCLDCRRWNHPPTSACPVCTGQLQPEPVSGRGSVYTFTVNAHQYHPEVHPPNLIAIVQLDEQDDLRIMTNIIRCDPEALHCGLRVRVLFERYGDVFYPVFAPEGGEG
jgi:uncharacterized OB-fold protein